MDSDDSCSQTRQSQSLSEVPDTSLVGPPQGNTLHFLSHAAASWPKGAGVARRILETEMRLRIIISEESSQEQQRLTSCKSLFTFDSRSRSRYMLASSGCAATKKSYSLQRFGPLSQSSDSESDSAPLLGEISISHHKVWSILMWRTFPRVAVVSLMP